MTRTVQLAFVLAFSTACGVNRQIGLGADQPDTKPDPQVGPGPIGPSDPPRPPPPPTPDAHPQVPVCAQRAQGPVASLPGIAPLSPAQPRVLFEDSFTDGALARQWSYWRMQFAEMAGRLHVLSAPRPGFAHGQHGAGRMAEVMTHIGDSRWTDYRLELEVDNLGFGQFNPYSVPSCYRGFIVFFRVASAEESWNEPDRTTYALFVNSRTCGDAVQGDVSLVRYHGWSIPGSGWSHQQLGSVTNLCATRSAAVIDANNGVRIDVKGRHIGVWINERHVLDFEDQSAEAIAHGGVGVAWGWESIGWLDKVRVTALD